MTGRETGCKSTRVRRLLILSVTVFALAVPASAGATTQSDDWPRLGASRLVTADGAFARGEPVWLFVATSDERRHSVAHSFWATTTNERGRFVLRAPYRGKIRHAAEHNSGWANFDLVGGAEGSSFWVWSFPAYWNGSGWDVERGALPRLITPLF